MSDKRLWNAKRGHAIFHPNVPVYIICNVGHIPYKIIKYLAECKLGEETFPKIV